MVNDKYLIIKGDFQNDSEQKIGNPDRFKELCDLHLTQNFVAQN